MPVAVRQGSDDVYHYVAESLVWDLEFACIDQLCSWFDLIARIATFNKCFDVAFQAGPVVLACDPGEGWFDADH